ncbi:3-dehydro-L-gulonate 2-dehydrogenase [Hyunsoonleella ulvae]|uniref:3-dehydro-L-gulonate 2-dehydrogenase n=1 Tax=Hyunsoonleella ulvae TaxID=2799948 RepID=UPI00193A3E68|nr:3-dehydro-L-gulonate 2-dehydrogenase [Hyunsoonleella ulvae]
MTEKTIRIPKKEMQNALYKLLINYKFTEENARLIAKTHTESSLVGVNSHGINRIPLFIEYLKKGIININAKAEKMETFGSIERWDGNFGSGVLNAITCTNRALALAKKHGMGLVALRNTNHWMRGGSYGYQAAEAGCISILFTNTQPNMPPWGGKDSRIGNNPFIVSIPRKGGHVVLDMAISQFSFGKINDYKLKGEKLPFYGGWDDNDQLSKDPESISKKERGLPIGFWKGSALSIILDMLATLLSAGNSTYRVSLNDIETGISQVYLCIYPEVFNDTELQDRLINEIIDYTHNVEPIHPDDKTYYPGERSSLRKAENLKNGIPVNKSIWEKIMMLS